MDPLALRGTVQRLLTVSVADRHVPRHAGGVAGVAEIEGVGDVKGFAGGLFALAAAGAGCADAGVEHSGEVVGEEGA